jgi:large subunit ribosomal protein L5
MTTKAKNKQNLESFEELWKNPIKRPRLEKIVLNIGVGTGGDELENAATVLEQITGRKAVKTLSKKNIKEFNLRKGKAIGTKVTLRGEEAEKLLKRLLIVYNNKILRKGFDAYGNFSFGIVEHIGIPGTEYDSKIGIWGLNVCGKIVRPGMRVKYRRQPKRAKIPKRHYVSRSEAQQFLKQEFGVEIVDKLELEYM